MVNTRIVLTAGLAGWAMCLGGAGVSTQQATPLGSDQRVTREVPLSTRASVPPGAVSPPASRIQRLALGSDDRAARIAKDKNSIEARQLQALLYRAGTDEQADSSRRRYLTRLRVPESEASPGAVRAGAERYLRGRWERNWRARLEEASLSQGAIEMLQGWNFYAEDEAEIYTDAARAGLDWTRLRPTPNETSDMVRRLAESASANIDQQATLLGRALLTPPDVPLLQAIIAHAARMPGWGGARHGPAFFRQRQWEHVSLSPEPALPGMLVDFACSPAGSPSAEAIVANLIFQGGRRPSWFTEAMLRRLIREGPQEAVTTGLKAARGSLGFMSMPFLADVALDPTTPVNIQLALITCCVANDPRAAARIFNGPPDPQQNAWRVAAFHVYAKGGAPPLTVADATRWADDPGTTSEVRMAALGVLTAYARSSDEAREGLRQLGNGAYDPAVRSAAEEAFLAADRAHAADEANEKARQEQNRIDADAGYAMFRDRLAKADRGEIQLSPQDRLVMEHVVKLRRSQAAEVGLQELGRVLRDYAKTHDGFLPKAIGDLGSQAPAAGDGGVIYLPPGGVRLRDLPSELLLGVSAEVFDFRATAERDSVALALWADGRLSSVTSTAFAAAWAKSDAARARLHLPPIDPSALGPMASWTHGTTQPATQPTTRPTGQ